MTLMGHRGRSVRSWPTPRASPNWDVQPKAAPRWTASRSPQGGRPTRRSATRAAERSESSLRPMGGVVIELALWRRLAAELLGSASVSYTHLRAHETVLDLVCRLLLEKKKNP